MRVVSALGVSFALAALSFAVLSAGAAAAAFASGLRFTVARVAAVGALEQREMRHQQAAKFAARLLRSFERALMLATDVGDGVVVAGDLALGGKARLLANEIGLFVRRGFDFVGRALREHERVLQRLFHRFEVTDALLEVGDFGFQRGAVLGLVLERLDDLVEKCVDVGSVVSLQRLLEILVLNVDRCDLLHYYVLLFMKSKVPSAIIESRRPAALTTIPAGTTR